MFNKGIDRMRRLVCEYYDGFSFGKFIKNFPDLKNTVTDLLIGDLFTDRVDKVWQPMETTYDQHKKGTPHSGASASAGGNPNQGQRTVPS